MRRVTGAAALALTVLVALTGCQAGGASSATPPAPSTAAPGGASSSVGVSPQASPTVTVTPADGATAVRPDQPVTVQGPAGFTVKTVTVTAAGATAALTGTTSADGSSWKSTGALAPATTYTVSAVLTGQQGQTLTQTSSFRTLTPTRTISATIVPGDDWEVGVGMPIVVTFAKAVKNKDAAVAALTVESTPAVSGAWRWMSASEVQWRPQEYWPSGTKVSVTAALGGVELSDGSWGKRTVTSRFTIGRQQISTVDVAAHTLTVRRDGEVIKTIPVTTGKAGFLTRNGVKVIMSREEKVQMDAASTGTDPKDPNYYNIKVSWAMRLTYSGEYLHAAPWSVGSQGRANVSHGCTGMSNANAKWMFDNSKVGDVVVYENSKRPLEWGNGYTVWNRSFAAWSTGA